MIRLHRCDGNHKDFLALINKLDVYLRSFTSDHDDLYISSNKLNEPVYATLAYEGDSAVGCACLRPYDKGVFELKRMYVLPKHRGRGISGMILKDLEEHALEMDGLKVILETGEILESAIGLYRKSGYKRIENYSPYEAVEDSLCFAKELSQRIINGTG